MASAEVVEAWKEYLKTVPMLDQKMRDRASFAAGFLAGRKLPEVKAEELREGKFYVAQKSDGECVCGVWDPVHGVSFVYGNGNSSWASAGYFEKFLGPLPLEDWGA